MLHTFSGIQPSSSSFFSDSEIYVRQPRLSGRIGGGKSVLSSQLDLRESSQAAQANVGLSAMSQNLVTFTLLQRRLENSFSSGKPFVQLRLQLLWNKWKKILGDSYQLLIMFTVPPHYKGQDDELPKSPMMFLRRTYITDKITTSKKVRKMKPYMKIRKQDDFTRDA